MFSNTCLAKSSRHHCQTVGVGGARWKGRRHWTGRKSANEEKERINGKE